MKNEFPFVTEDEHHPALKFLFDVGLRQYLKNEISFSKFNFKRANYDEINERLAELDSDVVLEGDNVDLNMYEFYGIIDDIVTENIPRSKLIMNFCFFFHENSTIDKKKNEIHKKLKRYPNLNDFCTFKNLRSLCKRFISSDRAKYVEKIEHDLAANSKHFFRYVSHKKNIRVFLRI